MESTGLPATAPYLLGGMLTLIGIVLAWTALKPGKAGGRRSGDSPGRAAASGRGGGHRPAGVPQPRRSFSARAVRVWQQTGAALRSGELTPGELLRRVLYHTSKAIAVISLAVIFGSLIGLVVRYLLGR